MAVLQAGPAAAATTASFSTTSTWDSGYEGKYTIANTGPAAITGWRVEFDLPASTVGTFWDTLMTRSANHYTFTNGDYNATIAVGRALGGDVTISFGGASGIELAQACTDVGALTAEYQAVVTAYQLRNVNFDIEGSAVAEPASISRRSAAIAALQRANAGLRVSLTLPVLPEGLGQNDDGHIYDQTDARQLVTFANGQHPGRLAFWELTRDRNACTGALFQCTNVPQAPFEFTGIFRGFTG